VGLAIQNRRSFVRSLFAFSGLLFLNPFSLLNQKNSKDNILCITVLTKNGTPVSASQSDFDFQRFLAIREEFKDQGKLLRVAREYTDSEAHTYYHFDSPVSLKKFLNLGISCRKQANFQVSHRIC
jgi:hypothetical protein